VNIQTITDAILDGSSPRAVIDLTESAQLKWYNWGRKLDQVIKTGGVMAAAAAPLVGGYAQYQILKAEVNKDEVLKYTLSQGHTMADYVDVLKERDPSGAEAREFLKSKVYKSLDDLQKEKTGAGRLMLMSLTASGVALGASMLGSIGIFEQLGLFIDRRKFRKNIKAGITGLLTAVDPMHRNEISALTYPLLSIDPFEDPVRYKRSLISLSQKLRSYNDPRYSHHTMSIDKFIEVLP